ncbi:MAG: substrate-binding domain-containing protein [Terracidiphilus sp.]|nr:substrate-binding domain-containing protein [Terracidiphilus sp.]
MKQADAQNASPAPDRKRSYTIRAVARAASVLHAFGNMEEVLDLKTVAARTGLNKPTVFRLLETLVESGCLERAGRQGYRSLLEQRRTRRFRIGYAEQSRMLPFTAVVSDGLAAAAASANIELLVLNNQMSARTSLQNAERFVTECVDLVIDSQINANVAAQIGARFSDASIPYIAIDIPHPGATYFGADNYKAGRIAGRYLGRWTKQFWEGLPAQVITLGVDAAGPLLNTRLAGMLDGLRELVPTLSTLPCQHYDTKGGQFEAALDTVRRHLRRARPGRTLVCAINDTTALGALQAFREAGMEQECAIAGQDASLQAREEMRRSSTRLICSVAYFPETYGPRLIQLALDILNRKPVPPAIFIEHRLVTPENVNRIYPNDTWMQEAAKHGTQLQSNQA